MKRWWIPTWIMDHSEFGKSLRTRSKARITIQDYNYTDFIWFWPLLTLYKEPNSKRPFSPTTVCVTKMHSIWSCQLFCALVSDMQKFIHSASSNYDIFSNACCHAYCKICFHSSTIFCSSQACKIELYLLSSF